MADQEPETVTKKELVNRIAEGTGHTKVVVKDVIQRFLDEIITELSEGNRLEFREFGVFEVRERAARRAQNPRTLEKVHVPAKRVVKFKVGRLMRERVCEGEPEPPRSPSRTPARSDAPARRPVPAGGDSRPSPPARPPGVSESRPEPRPEPAPTPRPEPPRKPAPEPPKSPPGSGSGSPF